MHWTTWLRKNETLAFAAVPKRRKAREMYHTGTQDKKHMVHTQHSTPRREQDIFHRRNYGTKVRRFTHDIDSAFQ